MPRGARLSLLVCFWSAQALAINEPQWTEFSKGEYVDSANVKSDGNVASGYIKTGATVTLYEVSCATDQIRTHSDLPRYVQVPAGPGRTVVQSDDGFRTVNPGTRNARIENAICGVVAAAVAKRSAADARELCEKAKHDQWSRVYLESSVLSLDERMCLSDLAPGKVRPRECDRAGVPKGITDATEYLHSKGIYLACEEKP